MAHKTENCICLICTQFYTFEKSNKKHSLQSWIIVRYIGRNIRTGEFMYRIWGTSIVSTKPNWSSMKTKLRTSNFSYKIIKKQKYYILGVLYKVNMVQSYRSLAIKILLLSPTLIYIITFQYRSQLPRLRLYAFDSSPDSVLVWKT